MSLIELALQRVKAANTAGTPGSAAVKGSTDRPAPLPPVPVQGIPVSPRAEQAGDITTPARELLEPELVINEAFLREKGLSALPGQEHQQRAEYRHIKYGLLDEIRRAGGSRLVVVTSALQGEGKSFSSVHLAMSLATEPDFSVLLVDADIIRPSLSRMFGMSDRTGLMDAVVDARMDVESLIVSTSIRGLGFLPAGRPNDHATEHFASARMHEVVRHLLSIPNRIVVVDSLPLLLTTEARALAPIGGQVVVVVRAESTPQSAVLQAVGLLGEGANVKLLLNGAVRSKALNYFGFGYGYEYTGNNKNR